MNEKEPKRHNRISRREVVELLGLSLFVAGLAAAGIRAQKEESENPKPEIKVKLIPTDEKSPFIPSVEIEEEIDSQSFKKVVDELFDFANKVDAGEFHRLEKITNTESIWTRKIPFRKGGLTGPTSI